MVLCIKLKHYNNTNNLVVGKIRNKTCVMSIKYFVGLKSKIYTFITEDNHKSNKAKSIHSIGFTELIKFYYLLTTIKNIYLKIDKVDYHIFINLHVNHKK